MTVAIHSKPNLLTPQKIEVRSEGEIVVLQVGNSELKMHYEDAFKISNWLRVRAKEAKRLCGDTSRHWSVLGTLENLE